MGLPLPAEGRKGNQKHQVTRRVPHRGECVLARIIISIESDAAVVEVRTSDAVSFHDGSVDERVSDWTKVIGANARAIREARGLTLREAADLCAAVGYPTAHTFIHKLETGEKNWALRAIVGICRAYGITPDALLLPSKTAGAR